MKALQKHYAAWLIATAMATGAMAHGTMQAGWATEFSMPAKEPSDEAPDADFVKRMMFYKESYTGVETSENVSLLMGMLQYLGMNVNMATADEIKIAEIVVTEMQEISEESNVLTALLNSCEKTIQPDEMKKWLMDCIRFRNEQFAYKSNDHIILNMAADDMERLSRKVLLRSEIDEFRGYYDKWCTLFPADDKEAWAKLERMGELLERMEKDVEASRRNGVDMEYAKQLDLFNREVFFYYNDSSTDRRTILKRVRRFIKRHAKGMNQATLDYTRGMYDRWSYIFNSATDRRVLMSVSKILESIQDRIMKEKDQN